VGTAYRQVFTPNFRNLVLVRYGLGIRSLRTLFLGTVSRPSIVALNLTPDDSGKGRRWNVELKAAGGVAVIGPLAFLTKWAQIPARRAIWAGNPSEITSS
jgi:hypothetical protein|tara:strand:+ start:2151 stop:2450 length:300 start_codon:yes stop_codon:yes gene_type:complete